MGKLQTNDIVVFNTNSTIVASAVVSHKTRNKALAEALWGIDQKSGNTWEHVYFLADIKRCDIPFGDLATATDNNGRISFTVYKQPNGNQAIKTLGFDDHRNVETPKKRNPNWTRYELILALELYFKDPSAIGNDTHPKVIELSETLNSLPIHPLEG